MPENLRAATPSRIRASAACCARFRLKSKRVGRGFERETVNSAGLPRFRPGRVGRACTGWCGEFRVTAAFDGDFASGGGERVDQSFLIGIELAFGGFQDRYFDRAGRVLRGGRSSRAIHFLRTIPASRTRETRVAERRVSSRTKAADSGAEGLSSVRAKARRKPYLSRVRSLCPRLLRNRPRKNILRGSRARGIRQLALPGSGASGRRIRTFPLDAAPCGPVR